MVWDVGGQEKLRSLWNHYYEKCRGLIFVVDSSDHERIEQARQELHKIVSHEEMQNAVILVLANKRDVATMNIEGVCNKLGLNELKRNWAIFPVCAIKEQGNNLDEAMKWLIDNVDDVEHPKKTVKVG